MEAAVKLMRKPVGLGLAGVLAIGALSGAVPAALGGQSAAPPAGEAPVGIIDAVGVEQAPILAAMDVTGSRRIDGYLFYSGTIDGHPVVDAFGGEIDESSELATYLMITNFHPRAMLFSGTAGAQAAPINVGDVVVSGFVVDKSNIHYQLGGYQTPYEGIEVHARPGADLAGAVIDGYDNPLPTPADAKHYGYGPSRPNKHWVYVSAFAGTRQLVNLAHSTPDIGTTTVADASGDKSAPGRIRNKLVVGVIGQAPVWTEPLRWLEVQDFLYQSDAEENEGSGFAFACASQGVPWMVIRGISDTPWHPKAYDGIVASDHAARVAVNVVDHLPANVERAPATYSDLSADTNAKTAGYMIANQTWYSVDPVTKVVYTDSSGHKRTLSGAALQKLEEEYTYGASKLVAGG
jgi:adenosylhomocysteine nucleosidase